MLQIVLFLIAIGIALFLWQAFPAFKWVLAGIATLIILVIALILYQGHMKVEKAEREEKQRAEQIQSENQEAKAKELASFEDSKLKLKQILAGIESKEQSGQKLDEQDLTTKAQVKIWLEQVEKNEADYKAKH